eukprot:12936509-Prorocentrum_lima.AAC.1
MLGLFRLSQQWESAPGPKPVDGGSKCNEPVTTSLRLRPGDKQGVQDLRWPTPNVLDIVEDVCQAYAPPSDK